MSPRHITSIAGRLVVLASLFLCVAQVVAGGGAQQVPTQDLETARTRLLESYRQYNPRYAGQSVGQVFAMLGAARQSVFDSIVRALFIELVDQNGKMGARPIEYIRAVHGIWGVRPMKTEGRWQFRLSIEADPRLWELLRQSITFSHSDRGAHVLRALPVGADDDTGFAGFQLVTNGVETFREPYPYPGLQLSFISAEPSTGDIDIDFDELKLWDVVCHNQPSNSDIGSVYNGHPHPRPFNTKYGFFGSDYAPPWMGRQHCKDSY